MLVPIKYINHIQESIFFDNPKLFIQTNDLHNFEWNVHSKNGKISGFSKGIISKSISIVIKGDTKEECVILCNQLFDVMEKDTLTKKYGKIVVGDYYLKCYRVGSKENEYIREQGLLKITLKMITDTSFWIKESKTTFGYGEGTKGNNLDYNRDFPSDYTSNMLGTELNNTNFVESNFLINIYGACENPLITIGGHVYEVSASIGANEYLTIDSINKTIILTHEDGTKENCFNLRNKESYIFQKILPGRSQVATNTEFKFDVVLLEERSEPKWT